MTRRSRPLWRNGIVINSKGLVPPLIAKWEPLMGVTVVRFFVQHMKTK